jgi:cytochrome c
MMKVVLVSIAILLATTSAQADVKLAEKNACMACHGVDKKVLGPAFKEVATKYSADRQALGKLASSIKAGGSGKWGPIPMPAQAALSDADTQTLATWILSLSKS